MGKIYLVLISTFCASVLLGQTQTHYVTLGSDSILYSNSQFRFTKFIDARKDTTKLGLLKENYDGKGFQAIQFPKDPVVYLSEFVNSVVDYSANAQNICVVIKDLQVNEEPLGAIELVKTRAVFNFYLIEKDEQYRLIKTEEFLSEHAAKEVSTLLNSKTEEAVRAGFYQFLSEPSSEGENSKWISLKELRKIEVPKKRLSKSPVGELDYFQNKFSLNGKSISKKDALNLMAATNDAEIDGWIKKHKRNGTLSYLFGGVASALVGYPLSSLIANPEDEFKGNYIMFGSMGIITSLLSAKANRFAMHSAVELFNERYNN